MREPFQQPGDTTAEAERLQLELYRGLAPGDKLGLVLDLIDTAESFSRAGIRLRHPQATEREVTLHLAELKYGREIAQVLADARGPGH